MYRRIGMRACVTIARFNSCIIQVPSTYQQEAAASPMSSLKLLWAPWTSHLPSWIPGARNIRKIRWEPLTEVTAHRVDQDQRASTNMSREEIPVVEAILLVRNPLTRESWRRHRFRKQASEATISSCLWQSYLRRVPGLPKPLITRTHKMLTRS